MKEHLSWWQENINSNEGMAHFKLCCGNFKTPFKKYVREYIENAGYKSVLDCGAGLCSEYFGFRNDRYEIDYQAIDITPSLVEKHLAENINIKEADIEKIPFGDDSVDVCICHDVLNHQLDFRKSISEMTRVASKEVIISFFLEFCDKDKKEWRAPGLIYRYYNLKEMKDWLERQELNYNFEDIHERKLLFIRC